ncbi:MAG: sugar phosphate isomerase/epimerase [Gemmatales bacterium]|nr:sugar phosphate isomerase/epimerase [Gemmatales bacterium]MDW8385479.1 sugar phosphate isomerase/epimerase family protein [Gemmatales bacterium]
MRYAICNETFEGWEHDRICRFVAELGYTGLELAPFTLAPRITEVTAERRRELRRQAEAVGVQILGLHWLLAKTEGFHLTSPDATIRRRTAEYLAELARCAKDLGGELLVLGSPAQRRIPAGHSREQAIEFALDTLRQVLPALEETGVWLCLEPLAPPEADFILSAAEGVEILDALAHPLCALHLDVKAMAAESTPTPDVIRRYGHRMKHFHANDANRRGPGFGDTDFVPIFEALRDIGYKGWVSIEVFDYSPDPETIARQSIAYLRKCAAQAGVKG